MNDEERVRYLELALSIEWEVGLKNYDAPGLPDDPDLKHAAAEAVMEELRSRYDELEPWLVAAHEAAVARTALELAQQLKAPGLLSTR